MRSPTSPYTFLSYLHEQDRLATFINRSTFAPTRREYADYMGWAAKKVINTPGTGVQVAFGEWVEDLEPVYDSEGEIYAVRLLSKDRKTGEKRVRVARNLVVSGKHRSSKDGIWFVLTRRRLGLIRSFLR